ncbi:MAG: AI-2E family transporter [Planctomycetes bacterium]|nr:AI-2E family transporter [Planctomycetota bacterium]
MTKRPGERRDENEVEQAEAELSRHHLAFWRFLFRSGEILNKGLIWAIFFFLLWLLRDFFPLIFVTFVFSFVTASACRVLGRLRPSMGWRSRVALVFSGFLLILSLLVSIAVPQVKAGVWELNGMVRDLPRKWEAQIDPWLYDNWNFYRRLVTKTTLVPIDGVSYRDEVAKFGEPAGAREGEAIVEPGSPETAATPGADRPVEPQLVTREERISFWKTDQVGDYLAHLQQNVLKDLPSLITDVVTGIMALVSLLFLAMLFSFLIVFDLDSLSREVKKLENTKLSDFYRETISSIVEFGAVLGKVLEAQAVIALVNALLTAIGLWLLGVPNVAFLSLFVFVCGFIPVAGVFISSVPICLVGLYVDGVPTLLVLVAFITGIHFLEAYVLNPRIMGAALHINPVLVLIILVIGHHALGVWGLLLGLPICYYFFTHVIKREKQEIGLRVKFKRNREELPAGDANP